VTQEQVVERFGHRHDSEDEATFFQGEAKATMRDALAAMWEAEGLLRTGRPSDALAPEIRALDILKVLQQADRAYVQRVGFEAAPLNIAERRLRGDVAGVPDRAITSVPQPAADEAVAAVRHLLKIAPTSGPAERLEALRRVEPGLTKAATDDPQVFVAALQALRRLATGNGSLRKIGSNSSLRCCECCQRQALCPRSGMRFRPRSRIRTSNSWRSANDPSSRDRGGRAVGIRRMATSGSAASARPDYRQRICGRSAGRLGNAT
jgi:hypothetical protein